MPERSPQLQLTTEDARVFATWVTLTGATIAFPGRAGRVAGLTLGAWLLRRHGVAIQSTDRQAREAAERGGRRYALLDVRVDQLEDLLAAAEPGGLHPRDVDHVRQAVVHRAVARRDPFRRLREEINAKLADVFATGPAEGHNSTADQTLGGPWRSGLYE